MNEYLAHHKQGFENGVAHNAKWLKDHPDLPQPRFRYLVYRNHVYASYFTDADQVRAMIEESKGTVHEVTEIYDLTHPMQAQLDTPGVWRL
jgi:hypothetical protein